MSSSGRVSPGYFCTTSFTTSILSRTRLFAIVALAMSVVPAWGQFESPRSIALGFSAGTQASADFNGDGKPDLAIYNSITGSVSIWLSNGDGSFQNRSAVPVAPAGTGGIVINTGDFDGDGKQDLLASGSIFRGNGDGTFGSGIKLQQSLVSAVTSDLNRDGKTDLALFHNVNCVTGYHYYECQVGISAVLSQGSGSFQQLPDIVADGSFRTFGNFVAGDFNGDGKLDLALAVADLGTGMSIFVFWGNGDGTFQPQLMSNLGYFTPQLLSGDFNGDGMTDLAWVVPVVTLNSQQVSPAQVAVMMSNGGRTFKAPVFSSFSTLPFNDAVVSADFDGDGKSDLALVSRPYVPPQVVNVLFSAGDGTFRGPSTVAINSSSNTGNSTFEEGGPSVGDFNGDGKVDLAIPMAEYNTEAILLNSTPFRDFNVITGADGAVSQTVTAGQTARYSLAVAPSNGFSGTVTLTCSGAPTAATCSVSPSSVSVSGTSSTPFTVSVATTSRASIASVWPRLPGPIGWMIALLLGGLLSVRFAAQRRALAKISTHAKGWLLALVFVVLIGMIGCGGGSSSTVKTPVQTGTPIGTYTVVVSATSGSTTHTQNLTLVVN